MRLSPLVCAHRGRSGVYPENTMAAYKAAVEVGADFMELDVRATADGEIVCIHDATVDRTTDGSGEVAQMALSEVRALDAGAWIGDQHAGERIPLLAEVLEQIAPRLVVDIEIKQRGIAQRVAEVIRETDAIRHVTVVSFDEDDLQAAKAAEPSLACGLITSWTEDASMEDARALVTSALEAGANFISCSHRNLTQGLVRECHLMGLLVMAWTMDEPEDIRRMIEMQADGLVSNYPERAIELLEG
jgi:glycerophosphoryl diester phosphodiesterase